jgi:LEA14-like dessication related protein
MILPLRCYIVILALMVTSGCVAFVQNPRITVHSTNVVGVDTAGFDIELLVGVENPNSFDISLLSYTYDLQIMAVPFSSGGLQKGVLFPAGQKVGVRLPFRVHHSDLLGIIRRRPDLDRLPYTLDARLNLSSPFGEIVIPVKKSDTISVPEAYRPGTFLNRMLQPLKEML